MDGTPGRPVGRTLVVAAVLVACGRATAPVRPYGGTPGGTGPAAPVASEVVERADWRLAEEAGDETLRVVVPIPSAASCGSLERVGVSESEDAVVVEAFVRRLVPGEGEGCTDDLAFREIAVQLDGDLGDRRLDGCDVPPEGSIYFDGPVPAEGCRAAVVTR